MSNDIYFGDCLEDMQLLDAHSIDMILCDLPYGTTACAWDSILPLDRLWAEYRRILKKGGIVALTAAQPFTTKLIASNLSSFRYCWYWNKNTVTGFANAKKQPLRCVEEVVIFYDTPGCYNPQGLLQVNKTIKNGRSVGGDSLRADVEKSTGKGSLRTPGSEYIQEFTNYPRQVLEIASATKTKHPTQKPTALFEYLIKTYTNENDVVLDNCAGSGTTGVACVNTNRKYILMEKEQKYIDIIQKRLGLA